MFFSDAKFHGQPKIARALTGFIEATNVKEVYSGGVKLDKVDPSGGDGGSAMGYGNVPYPRTEFTAQSIEMYVSIDVGQIEAYGLSTNATELLLAIARWEVRSLLDRGLRLRTACEFESIDNEGTAGLAETDALERQIRDLISSGVDELDGADATPLEVRWPDKKKRS